MATTAKLIKSHSPCPCGQSSDAYSEWEDHGWCFSGNCTQNRYFKKEPMNQEVTIFNVQPNSKQREVFRGIEPAISEKYKITTVYSDNGTILERQYIYPTFVKRRFVSDKSFKTEGPTYAGLFGKELFNPGSLRSVTIVEGEEDAPSVYQMLQGKTAAVSVQSSSTALRDCKADRDWINSFDRIYLSLDNDEAGKKATEQIASLFDFNKIFYVNLTKKKDANDYLKEGLSTEYRDTWYAAKRYTPEGIISSYKEFADVLEENEGAVLSTLPFPELNGMLGGLHENEIVLIDGLEGLGKTEIIRAIEYHLLTTTDLSIGSIHLEEPKKRQLQGLAGLFLEEPLHLTKSRSNEETLAIIKEITKRDERLHLYSHFGSDDPSIIVDRIRYMVSVLGCKVVTLDHITMVVTGLDTDDERRVLDMLSTRLAMLVQELNFCLIMVSHINDEGQTRGSRNISKVANARITLDRDLLSDDPTERNTTRFIVKKNRNGALTGYGGSVLFDVKKFLLTPIKKDNTVSYNPGVPF